MADCPGSKPTISAITKALRQALARLRGRDFTSMPQTCAELWDDSLELIELLIVIEEELQASVGANQELDWRSAPKRTATTSEFIFWIERELSHDINAS